MAACSAGASGRFGLVTFDEKPATALVPGDQVVYRDGSQLARADLRTIARVDHEGDLVYVTFDRGKLPHRVRGVGEHRRAAEGAARRLVGEPLRP